MRLATRVPGARWRAMRPCLMGVAGIALGQAVALAQLASDEVPSERTIPAKEQIEADLQRSRLRLGPIRLIPSISVQNAGYDNNVYGTSQNPVGDWYFTIRGGLRFLLPMGGKMYFRAEALPQYTWDELPDRRTYGGVANATLYAFFNRMTLQLRGSGSRDFSLYSTELLTRVLTKTVDGLAGADVQVAGPVSIFGKGEVQKVRYDSRGQLTTFDVTLNDRTDSAVRGGVRFRLTRQWNVSTAVEQTWSDFVRSPETRNNQSRAYLLGVNYDRPSFYVALSGGYREGRPRDGSSFPAYSTPTGSFFVSYVPIRWLELQAYGRRGVSYSISDVVPYYFENQIGGGVNFQPIDRLLLRGYATTGPNQYPEPERVGETPVTRRDKRTLYGGGLSAILDRTGLMGKPVVLTGLVTRIDTKSNIAADDRSVTRFTVALSFSGELSR
jgi:hypothetical protein